MLGIYLLLIIINCVVFGVLLFNIVNGYNFVDLLLFGVGSVIGFLLVLIFFVGICEWVEGVDVLVYFCGLVIVMVMVGLMVFVFMGFVGLDKY